MRYQSGPFLVALLFALGGHAQAASTLYAGTNLGPYVSVDGGATWKQVLVTATDPTLQGVPEIRALGVDQQNPSNVYAASDFGSPNALLKSTDAGKTWTAIAQPGIGFGSGPGTFAIDPVQTNVMYAKMPSPGRLIKSIDGGQTWTIVTLPKPASAGGSVAGVTVSSVATDPNNSGVVYTAGPNSNFAAGRGYVFKSTDFGTTWTILAEQQSFAGDIYVDPHNSQTIFVSNNGNLTASTCPSISTGGKCGLFKSVDAGKTWTEMKFPAAGVGNLVFDVTPGVLYAGASYRDASGQAVNAVVKSVDAGQTWAPVKGGFFFSAPFVRADPADASTVYMAASTSGNIVYKSTDGGSNWTQAKLPDGCNAPNEAICSFPPRIHDFVVAPTAGSAPPPPAIAANGVVNAASLQSVIVANSWVTIFGTNLASKTDNWGHAIVNGQLPTSLDGVSVTIGGKAAYVYFISPGQINVLAPDIPPGPVAVTVRTAAGTSATFTATAAQYNPAFFEWPNNQPVATRQDYTYAVKAGTFPGATTVAAKPGDVLILWATGFGPTTPVPPAGVPVPADQAYATATKPTVTINNVPVKVFGAALASGSVGLYQVAIQVPSSLADGDWPIQATIGGVQSPTGILLSVHH